MQKHPISMDEKSITSIKIKDEVNDAEYSKDQYLPNVLNHKI